MECLGGHLSDRSLVLAAAVSLCLIVTLRLHYYYKNRFSYWAKRGVRGPRPWPVLGNLPQMVSGKRREIIANWRREYGTVFGIYEGTRPVLVVADPEVARQITIKDFDFFPNHDNQMLVGELNSNFVFLLNDERWRHVRSVLTPTFTSGKMRRMYKLMELCADDLSAAVEEQFEAAKTGGGPVEGPIVQLKDLFDLFTIDAMASCCYGIKLERQKGSARANLKGAAVRNEFVRLALKMFHFPIWRIVVAMSFSQRLLKRLQFTLVPDAAIAPFVTCISQLIERRRADKSKKFDDYLQILLDAGQPQPAATKSSAPDENDLDAMEAHHAGIEAKDELEAEAAAAASAAEVVAARKLDDMTLLASAVFLLAVGMETTGTLLTHCIYALAFHADVQERLHAEVSKIGSPKAEGGWSFEYEALIGCAYLDAVISETLRAQPAAQQTDRESSGAYVIKKLGLELPAGSKVMLALADLMNNEHYWRQPERFDPERFMPENRDKIVPGSYCPFGLGPRHCLGMRFSLTEAKFGLARLSMAYKFEPAPNTHYPPTFGLNFGFGAMQKPLVRALRR